MGRGRSGYGRELGVAQVEAVALHMYRHMYGYRVATWASDGFFPDRRAGRDMLALPFA